MSLLVAAIILWVVPIFVAHAIGKPKRRAGALYGVFLGWLGVIILAVLSPKPEPTLEDLERMKRSMSPLRYEQIRREFVAARNQKACPHCKESMRRDALVCPHCHRESLAWTFHEGRWWAEEDGRWVWLDELTNEWHEAQPVMV